MKRYLYPAIVVVLVIALAVVLLARRTAPTDAAGKVGSPSGGAPTGQTQPGATAAAKQPEWPTFPPEGACVDGDFSGWTLKGIGSEALVTLLGQDGNPGACLDINTSGADVTAWGFAIHPGLYDPSKAGAVTGVQLAIETKGIQTKWSGHAIAPAVLQDGRYYVATPGITSGDVKDWKRFETRLYTPAMFVLVQSDGNTAATIHPDLSGAAFRVGFAAGASGTRIEHLYDNCSIKLLKAP